MRKVAIVIDSTPRMSEQECKKYGIEVIPLTVVFDDGEYLDGVEITTDEFYEKLVVEKKLASTSQPSPGMLTDVFERLSKDHDEIVFITMTSGMSGTYQSASALANILLEDKGIKINVFDSKYTAGIGVDMAIQAATLADTGANANEIIKRLEQIREKSKLYLIVDDLSHMYRMGRIGKAAKVLGSSLKIKPVLQLLDGEVAIYKKMRTFKKTVLKMIEELEKNYTENLSISIISGDCDEYSEFARKEILKFANPSNVRMLEASPIIAAHTGSNAMCICWTDIS